MKDVVGDWAAEEWPKHLEDELRMENEMSKHYGVYGLDELDISDEDVAQVWGELQDVPAYTERFVVLPVLMEDDLKHTFDNPYCSSESCPCHTDEALFAEYIEQPMMDGLLTSYEASRLQWGETL